MRHTKTLASIGAAAVVGAAVYVDIEPTAYKTYIYGSPGVPHDIYHGFQVKGTIEYGHYCTDEVSGLLRANRGDVAITMRAGSAEKCRYVSDRYPTIAVAGWSNAVEDVGDVFVENALTISAGASYGKSVGYYLDEGSLSAAMPVMANIINTINQARRDAGLTVYDTAGVRRVLDVSSDEVHEVDGRHYGQRIDLDEAVRLATIRPESINPAVLPAIYSVLFD